MWYRWSKVGTLPFIKYYSVYCHQFHGIHAFSSSYSSVSVISYSYNLGDFVNDFYELSMILISYELELNRNKIKSYRSKKVLKLRVLDRP